MSCISKLVSVIVPVYNVEKYLSKCIQSIIDQSYKNLEIILIDDGSNDASLKICNSFKDKDSRIKVITKENQGVSIARNVGLTQMSGEYVIFVDSDDCIASDLVENCIRIFEANMVDLVIYPYLKFSLDEELDNIKKETYTVLFYNQDELFEEMFKGHNGKQLFRGLVCNKMYKSKLFSEIEFPIERKFGEDTFVTYMIFKKVKKALYIDGIPLYYYRNNPSSALNSKLTYDNLAIIDTYNDILTDAVQTKSCSLELIEYAYVNRLFEFISRVKNEKQSIDLLFVLRERLKIKVFRILKNRFININIKVLCLLLFVNVNVFKKIYWKL